MKLELATTFQLKNIISHDEYCPTRLLIGVVTELMNRSELDGIVKKVIIARFMKIEIAINVLGIAEDDLFQFCRMKIFEAVEKYQPGRTSFLYFVFIKVKRDLKDLETKAKAEMRKVYIGIQSIDKERDETGNSYADIFHSSTNVEKEVIRKISLEEKLDPLKPMERTSFLLYMKGYSGTEIGVRLGISPLKAIRRVNSALSKMCGRKITVKELGLTNYGKGA